MSFAALNWALKQPLHGCRKFVLVVLANHANNLNECWPSVKVIAEECGLTRSSVINHLNEITKLGLIEKQKRFDEKGYRRSTLYRLKFDQSIENQSSKNQDRFFEIQGQDFHSTKVQELDSNIIERTLECLKEPTNLGELGVLPLAVPPRNRGSKVEEIFRHWQCTMDHPQSKLDDKRRRKILQALKLGYSVEDLKTAITGCSKSPYHMGRNDSQQRYDTLELILRDAAHIDRFIANVTNPPVPDKQGNQINDLMAGVIL